MAWHDFDRHPIALCPPSVRVPHATLTCIVLLGSQRKRPQVADCRCLQRGVPNALVFGACTLPQLERCKDRSKFGEFATEHATRFFVRTDHLRCVALHKNLRGERLSMVGIMVTS